MLRRRFTSSTLASPASFTSFASSAASAASLLRTPTRAAVADYKSPLDFDPVQMKFFLDGIESEMMDDARKVAMAAVQQHKLTSSNRSVERETQILRDRMRFMMNPPAKILSKRSDTSSASADNFLVSLAQFRTTPAKFYAMFESTAMVDAPLAYGLASHFTLSSCLTSAYRPHLSAITSGNVDNGASLFTAANTEVVADDAPFQCIVTFERTSGMLRASTREAGGGKLVHVLGSSARFAVVSCQYMSRGGQTKPHLLLVELRDAAGKLRPGISVKGLGSTGGAVDGLASCVLHLDNVALPIEALLTGDVGPQGAVVAREASLDAATELLHKASSASRKKAAETPIVEEEEEDDEVAEQQKQPDHEDEEGSYSAAADAAAKQRAKDKAAATLSAAAADAEHAAGRNPLELNAMLNHATVQRLTISSLALGKCKRMLHDMVRFTASKKIQGPTGERDHPMMGVQVIQKRVALSLVQVIMLNVAFRRVLKTFSEPGGDAGSSLTTEDFVELAAVSSELVETVASLARTGVELCAWQALPAAASFNEGLALSALWREGTSPEYVRFLYSRECIENSIGLLRNVSLARQKIVGNSAFSKFLANPFFTPTTNDINRYLLLFGEKELQTRSVLQTELRVAQRRGAEDMFYVWNNEQLRGVLSHSDAYLSVLCLRAMHEALQKSRDPYNSRVINDVAWLWSLNRIDQDLPWYIQHNAIRKRQIKSLHTMLDNLCNLLSHQAVHLVDCFGLDRLELDSPLAKDWEAYYGPPKSSSSSSSSSSK